VKSGAIGATATTFPRRIVLATCSSADDAAPRRRALFRAVAITREAPRAERHHVAARPAIPIPKLHATSARRELDSEAERVRRIDCVVVASRRSTHGDPER
jgi:hypothetical protein